MGESGAAGDVGGSYKGSKERAGDTAGEGDSKAGAGKTRGIEHQPRGGDINTHLYMLETSSCIQLRSATREHGAVGSGGGPRCR